MKCLTTLLLTTLFTALAHTYELHVYFQDQLEIRVTGDWSSPCQDFPAVVKGNKVVKVTFDKGAYTNEYMLWSQKDCQGEMVSRGGTGVFALDGSQGVGSLKVL